MMPRPHAETYEKRETTDYTDYTDFFLRVSSCNFVANFLVIFIVIPHDGPATPGDH